MHSYFAKRIFIAIGVFTGVVALIVGGVIYPTYVKIQQINQDTNTLRVSLERKNEQATNYRIAIKQMEKIRSEMPDFSKNIFYSGQELSLIDLLETEATRDGVTQKIASSNIDNITNQRIQFSLSVSGSYSKIVNYLSGIEHLPYFITINKLVLSSQLDRTNPDLTASDLVLANLDLSLYVIPQPTN